MSDAEPLYRVHFFNDDKIFELYAKSVGQSGIFGFIVVEEIVFGETTQVLVDPAEEKLRAEFSGVHRLHIPMQAVIRIDEVESRGVSKIRDSQSMASIKRFPSLMQTNQGYPEKDA